MPEEPPESDIIRLRFEGGLADENRVPLPEFVTSLEGWRDFFILTADAYIQERLTTHKPDKAQRLRYDIRAIREGSVITELIGGAHWLGENYLAGATQAAGAGSLYALWKLRTMFYHQQVDSHRRGVTVEEAAAALEHLARENGLSTGGDDDPVEFVEKVDKSIKMALRPVITSVNHVTAINQTTNIFIVGGSSEKNAMESEYAAVTQPVQVDLPEERKIWIREINLDTQHIKFHFDDPQSQEERGIKHGQIVDARLSRPRDPYTGSIYERKLMQPIGTKKTPKLSNRSRAVGNITPHGPRQGHAL